MFGLLYFLLCLALAVLLVGLGAGAWTLGASAIQRIVDFKRHREVKKAVAALPDFVPADWEHAD